MSGRSQKPAEIGPPVEEPRVVIRWAPVVDAERTRRVARVLQSILDNEITPADGAKS